VTGSTFIGNYTIEWNYSHGGGISNVGRALTIENGNFSGNSAGIGGGIYNIGGAVMVTNSSLTTNNAKRYGGAVFNDGPGTLLVANSSLTRNNAQEAAGGIGNKGTLTVTSSSIINNVSSSGPMGTGGGIQNSANGIATLINVTFSGNRAQGVADDGGGGIMVYGGGVNLINSTLYNNTTLSTIATDGGGGISIKSGSTAIVMLTNTLVISNTSAVSKPDLSGNFISGGYNLIGSIDGSAGITNGVNSDIAGTNATPIDAKLGMLGNYGGAMQTIPLLPGSPAIDWIPVVNSSCNNTGVIADQRGVSRPYPLGGNCDIGAFEFNGIVYHYLYLPLIRR
jgi:hypothetical protein